MAGARGLLEKVAGKEVEATEAPMRAGALGGGDPPVVARRGPPRALLLCYSAPGAASQRSEILPLAAAPNTRCT